MLKILVQNLGDVVILHCQGRIVRGTRADVLQFASLRRRETSTLVMDLQCVTLVDAAGLGALLSLHHRTRAKMIQLKLMNVVDRLRELFELTRLDQVFEFCSVEEMCRMLLRPPDQHAANRTHNDPQCT
jgi:anti-anti-sigma factor